MDYSHKYGLGYCLQSGATGVHFNDGSSIVLESTGRHFTYVPADTSTGETETYALDGRFSRPDLSKKVHLLKHFREYMHSHLSAGDTLQQQSKKSSLSSTTESDRPAAGEEVVYLTRYRKLSGGILFVMSDGTVQCNFTDHAKLAVAVGSAGDPSDSFARFIDTEKRVVDGTVESLARGTGGAGQEGRDKLKLLYAHLSE